MQEQTQPAQATENNALPGIPEAPAPVSPATAPEAPAALPQTQPEQQKNLPGISPQDQLSEAVKRDWTIPKDKEGNPVKEGEKGEIKGIPTTAEEWKRQHLGSAVEDRVLENTFKDMDEAQMQEVLANPDKLAQFTQDFKDAVDVSVDRVKHLPTDQALRILTGTEVTDDMTEEQKATNNLTHEQHKGKLATAIASFLELSIKEAQDMIQSSRVDELIDALFSPSGGRFGASRGGTKYEVAQGKEEIGLSEFKDKLHKPKVFAESLLRAYDASESPLKNALGLDDVTRQALKKAAESDEQAARYLPQVLNQVTKGVFEGETSAKQKAWDALSVQLGKKLYPENANKVLGEKVADFLFEIHRQGNKPDKWNQYLGVEAQASSTPAQAQEPAQAAA
ncbi:MAG TPA: hypothetical protein VF209_02285 [Patescibacteria group bacterium]